MSNRDKRLWFWIIFFGLPASMVLGQLLGTDVAWYFSLAAGVTAGALAVYMSGVTDE